MRTGFLVGALALLAAIPTDLSAQETPIKILFLGDNGHHKPNDRFRQLQPVLEKRGIELSYTGSADALNAKTGIDINKRRISSNMPRETGTHRIPVRLGTELSPELLITIVREGELKSVLAAREAAAKKAAEKALEEETRPEGAYVPYTEPVEETPAAETTETPTE